MWRDAFAPTLKELLYSSYRLANTLLKDMTNPPHVQISELVSKEVTDDSLTNVWELFGSMPMLSAAAFESEIKVHKDNKSRDALLALIAFINEFHEITKAYYKKERIELSEEDNLEFSKNSTYSINDII
ncbi:MAG: hypothetical protein ACRCXC_02670 [Legionella sp.]